MPDTMQLDPSDIMSIAYNIIETMKEIDGPEVDETQHKPSPSTEANYRETMIAYENFMSSQEVMRYMCLKPLFYPEADQICHLIEKFRSVLENLFLAVMKYIEEESPYLFIVKDNGSKSHLTQEKINMMLDTFLEHVTKMFEDHHQIFVPLGRHRN